MSQIPLIPRKVFFSNPDKASPRISPDGKTLGYLAPVNGVLNVWAGPTDNIQAARPVTQDTVRGIRFFSFAYTNQHILYIQDRAGDENWRIYCVDLATAETHDLTPIEGVRAQILGLSSKFPDTAIIGLNQRAPEYHDIYNLNLLTGERKLLLQHDRFAGFDVDDDLQIRLAAEMLPDGGMLISKMDSAGAWVPFDNYPAEDMLTTGSLGFDKTGGFLYLTDSRGRNTSALVRQDLQTGEKQVIAEDSRADFSGVLVHPAEKTIQAVSFTYERRNWQILDPTIQADWAALKALAAGDFEIVSQTLDNQLWVVSYVMDNGPIRSYIYNRQTGQAQFLFTNRTALENLPLAQMHSVVVPSRDNFDLVTYYTLPFESNTETGIPDKPLPAALLVHGGPWARDNWGYHSFHQWLSNRGYVVISVNFRGSTGLGKAFSNAGDKEWAGKMHDDLLDVVEWAVQNKIADPQKIAIMGGSYGGYATLVGLTFTPEVFACGVDIVGPSNLITLLESIPPYWKPTMEMFTTRVGDIRTEEGRAFLQSRSPLSYVERICRPLLIGQGANDPRVKQAEADQITQAMQAHNIPVTYVLYPDEGHGFARPANNLSFNAITEAFLGHVLGGRVEPVGNDFSGSSLTIPTGKEFIPGIA
jgi:dipeptidyl aminopeptidase/acylaminoacyl peptidase